MGQKFAATTFGGQRGISNLVPKLYGAESYVTDIDVNILPNAIYRHYVITGANVNAPSREVLNLGDLTIADRPLFGSRWCHSLP